MLLKRKNKAFLCADRLFGYKKTSEIRRFFF